MTLAQWIKQEGRGAKARLARETGLGFNTILYLVRGEHPARYQTARLISDATGGAVTIEELCEPARAKRANNNANTATNTNGKGRRNANRKTRARAA